MRAQDGCGRMLEEVFHPVDSDGKLIEQNPVRECLSLQKPVWLQEGASVIARDGSSRDIQDSAAPIRTADGTIIGTILVFQDVSRLRSVQREMAFHARHDSLTLLPNRKLFLESLQDTLHKVRLTGMEYTLSFLDLDQFKLVNDTAGHGAGDMLLRLVGDTLTRHVKRTDLVARLGGDEFALVLEGSANENARGRLSHILEEISALAFHWEERIFRISASIGITAIEPDSDAGKLMKQADVACYAAKHAGRNRISLFRHTESEGHDRQQEIQIAADIRDAIEQSRFSLFAQKIVDLSDDQVPRYELLLRMRDRQGAFLQPAQFIPAAERYDEMAGLDRWVLSTVLRDLAPRLQAIPGLRLSVNVSAQSLNDPNFIHFFLDLIERSPLHPSALALEITETSLINNLASANAVIEQARNAGCAIALDDFGSGLCSFSYLRNFKVDFIKIEGTFVRNIVHKPVDLSIVKAINNIAHELQARTVAEFVENERILEKVCELGIDLAQGYGLGRPVPIETVLDALPMEVAVPGAK